MTGYSHARDIRSLRVLVTHDADEDRVRLNGRSLSLHWLCGDRKSDPVGTEQHLISSRAGRSSAMPDGATVQEIGASVLRRRISAWMATVATSRILCDPACLK